MEKANPYLKLAHYVLPEEIKSSFDLIDVSLPGDELHLFLEEKNEYPESYDS
jgi:hypothetical protein